MIAKLFSFILITSFPFLLNSIKVVSVNNEPNTHISKKTLNISKLLPDSLDSILKKNHWYNSKFMSIILDYTGKYVVIYDGEKIYSINIETKLLTSTRVISNDIMTKNKLTFLVSSTDDLFLFDNTMNQGTKTNNVFKVFQFSPLNSKLRLANEVVYPKGAYIIENYLKSLRTIASTPEKKTDYFLNNGANQMVKIEGDTFDLDYPKNGKYDIVENKLYFFKGSTIFCDNKFVVDLNKFRNVTNVAPFEICIHNGIIYYEMDSSFCNYNIREDKMISIKNINIPCINDIYINGFYSFGNLPGSGDDIILYLYERN
jgi:hypothetical protein